MVSNLKFDICCGELLPYIGRLQSNTFQTRLTLCEYCVNMQVGNLILVMVNHCLKIRHGLHVNIPKVRYSDMGNKAE